VRGRGVQVFGQAKRHVAQLHVVLLQLVLYVDREAARLLLRVRARVRVRVRARVRVKVRVRVQG
jgi:hypothetical protein